MIRRNKNVQSAQNPKKKKLSQNEETKVILRENGEQSLLMHESSNTKTINNEAEIDDLVAPEFDEQSPPIYELSIELMMEIFNSLALKDLDSAPQTSKWWQKVAHACFRQNYSFLRTGILKKRLVFTRERGFEAFKQLIPILSISNTLDFKPKEGPLKN